MSIRLWLFYPTNRVCALIFTICCPPARFNSRTTKWIFTFPINVLKLQAITNSHPFSPCFFLGRKNYAYSVTMLSVYMFPLLIFETTVRFWRKLARNLCNWEARQRQFITMRFLLCQWNSSAMEADWRQARAVKSCVQTQVSPLEVCDELNGTGTGFSPGTSGYPSQCSLTNAKYSFIIIIIIIIIIY